MKSLNRKFSIICLIALLIVNINHLGLAKNDKKNGSLNSYQFETVRIGLIVDGSSNTLKERYSGSVYSNDSSTPIRLIENGKYSTLNRVKSEDSFENQNNKPSPTDNSQIEFAPSLTQELITLPNSIYNPNCAYGVLADINGKEYKTVKIGEQDWMANNLDVNTFQNGDIIPEANTNEEWKDAANQGKPAWCYFNYDVANGQKFGKLYNWFAVNDKRGLAPKGWHVPSISEWKTLIKYLGGEKIAAQKMRSKTGWKINNNSANESGFMALPGSYLQFNKFWDEIGYKTRWWSTTESAEMKNHASFLGMTAELIEMWDEQSGCYCTPKTSGLSVRCIQGELFEAHSSDNNVEIDVSQNDRNRKVANELKRDPDPRKDYANVFYKPQYTLFDHLTDEPIFPDSNGIYTIYIASNENKRPQKLIGSGDKLSQITMYKFKNLINCQNWCNDGLGVAYNKNGEMEHEGQSVNGSYKKEEIKSKTNTYKSSNVEEKSSSTLLDRIYGKSSYAEDSNQEGSKFCFNDRYDSGNKFELRLIDGGIAKLVIKNSSGQIIRTGEGSWEGRNDGPGGNAPQIILRLSTGTLRFTAIVGGYPSSINMLIDSKDNQWLRCF